MPNADRQRNGLKSRFRRRAEPTYSALEMTVSNSHREARPTARTAQTFMRWIVVTAAIATGIVAIFFWPATTFFAIALVVLYLLFVVVSFGARLAQRPVVNEGASETEPPSPDEPARSDSDQTREPALMAERRAGWKVALGIAGSLLLIAIILAAALLDWRFVVIGAIVVFCYLALFGGPYWIAAIEEEADIAREEITGTHRAIH